MTYFLRGCRALRSAADWIPVPDQLEDGNPATCRTVLDPRLRGGDRTLTPTLSRGRGRTAPPDVIPSKAWELLHQQVFPLRLGVTVARFSGRWIVTGLANRA